jgi:hypothetical protein
VLSFVLLEWLILTEQGSFSGLLSLVGTITVPLLGGVFPMLMLAASRRKGDYVPGTVLGVVGHPVSVAGISALFLAGVLAHGLVIWESPLERLAALGVTVLIVGMTIIVHARGAFRPRTVIELRRDDGLRDGAVFNVTSAGRPAPTEVRLASAFEEQTIVAASGEIGDLARLRSVTVEIPEGPARELKVWLHRVSPTGDSSAIPATLELNTGAGTRREALGLGSGQLVLPPGDKISRLRIMPEPGVARGR